MSTEPLDDDYGVERTPDGDVKIRLGAVMPFELPPEAAIRLAALLCKKAGCEILFRQGSMKIKFPRGFEFGNETSTAERVAENEKMN
jgi:hypothetical protein